MPNGNQVVNGKVQSAAAAIQKQRLAELPPVQKPLPVSPAYKKWIADIEAEFTKPIPVRKAPAVQILPGISFPKRAPANGPVRLPIIGAPVLKQARLIKPTEELPDDLYQRQYMARWYLDKVEPILDQIARLERSTFGHESDWTRAARAGIAARGVDRTVISQLQKAVSDLMKAAKTTDDVLRHLYAKQGTLNGLQGGLRSRAILGHF